MECKRCPNSIFKRWTGFVKHMLTKHIDDADDSDESTIDAPVKPKRVKVRDPCAKTNLKDETIFCRN